MNLKHSLFGLLTSVLISCHSNSSERETYLDLKIAGAMRNVMWKGELGSNIDLDTIWDKNGLYGIGPVSYLRGELLINNGKSYVSRVTSDSSMSLEETFEISAPFFVYGNVKDWNEIELPAQVKTLQDLEQFIDEQTKNFKRPFAFKLTGQVSNAIIHIQNLPEGTSVSSPDEAHQGQINYELENEEVEIVGFFSTEHQGVFTHHDSFVHMHLITKDETKMGHLDELEIGKMNLLLPKK
ncbi:MAG: acetolactate decarboxylase [Algoriphagus sp.]|uniref:acetolactate decarboxylase n=1 Tax=Algoriphagus sp. TaxID=1872435 RepID=UPI0017983CB2|nr:acetolactate decarboxylase [Algoriphagus sp.]NVJ86470.1 acetolactate decarboxylase [Algoriphagus sp.]